MESIIITGTDYLTIGIAIYLITRILTQEVVTDFIRIYLSNNKYYRLFYLFQCPFCMSFYVTCLIVLANYILYDSILNIFVLYIISLLLFTIIREK